MGNLNDKISTINGLNSNPLGFKSSGFSGTDNGSSLKRIQGFASQQKGYGAKAPKASGLGNPQSIPTQQNPSQQRPSRQETVSKRNAQEMHIPSALTPRETMRGVIPDQYIPDAYVAPSRTALANLLKRRMS